MAQKQPADKLGGQRQGSLKMGERSGLPRHNTCHRAFGNTVRKPWIAPFRQHRNKRFQGGKYEKTACFHTLRHISPEYRWNTVLCISFPFDHKPLWHKPSTSTKRRIEAAWRHYTNEKAARISEPLLPCKHKKTPLRIWTVFGARDGTWTHTSKTHAPQTCLSAYSSTLAYFLTCLISQLLYYSTADIYIHQ